MYKLLSADLRRLWINKAFWISIIITACVEGGYCLLYLNQASIPMDYPLFIALQSISITASIFFSLFTGTEYNDGTLRNKLIAGHKRSRIYLASLATGIIAITIIYLTGILTGIIVGNILCAPAEHSIGQITIAGVVGWFAYMSYIAIFNFIGMLSSSKTKTSIICIMTNFSLMITGFVLHSIVSQNFLIGNSKVIFQFLDEFNPFGQTIQTMSIQIAEPFKLISYALILSLILTGLGIFAFRKKDLK